MSFCESVPLGDLVVGHTVSYGIVQPGTELAGGVPIIRVKDLKSGTIDRSDPMHVEPAVSDRHSRTVLQGGELLLSLVGTVGESAVVPASMAGWNVARAIAVIRPDQVEARWLQLCFDSAPVAAQLQSMLNTTVQATLNLRDLLRVRIPMPTQDVRGGILDVLGALDDKIAANKSAAVACVDLADAIFAQALCRVDVQWRSVAQLATTVLGGTPSRTIPEYWSEGTIAWINSGRANAERITEPSERITTAGLRSSAAKLMPRRATVIAITGATMGQMARLEIEAAGNQSLVGVWSDDPALNDWIYFALRGRRDELVRKGTGAAQQHVNKQDIDGLPLPVVGAEEVQCVGRQLRPLLDSAAASDFESVQLSALRDTLLPQLISGKLRVRDAEKVVGGVV